MSSKAFHSMGCMQVCTCDMLQDRLEAAILLSWIYPCHWPTHVYHHYNVQWNPLGTRQLFIYLDASFNEKGDTI